MFLILSLPQCDYCQNVKTLLDNKKIPYMCIDVTTMCGNNWRGVFKQAFPLQRNFPVIFDVNDDMVKSDITLEELKTQMLIGNYFDLEEHLEMIRPILSDEY